MGKILKAKKCKAKNSTIELFTPELLFLGESGQPYRGSVYIQIVISKKTLDLVSFKKYITSLRQKTMFVEESSKTIYKDLVKVLKHNKIKVTIDLTARGGIQSRIMYGDKIDLPNIKKPLVFQV